MTGEYLKNRILTADGTTVVAYLCPLKEINGGNINALFVRERSKGKEPVTKDVRLIKTELTLQGEFQAFGDTAADHQLALQNLFSRSTVTPMEQWRRLHRYARVQGGQFRLYLGDDEYTAAAGSADYTSVDGITGPKVSFKEWHYTQLTNPNLVRYTLILVPGDARSSGES